jgi:cytosine/adenosine deaminase-related metal-dependent hydrolase
VLGRDDIGQLAPGMAADIVLFGLEDIGLAGAMHDPLAALAFTTGIRRAQTVLVNGKTVVREGQLVGLDLRDLFKKANRQAAQMVERAHARTKIDFLARRS